MDLLQIIIDVLPMRYVCAGSFMVVLSTVYALVIA